MRRFFLSAFCLLFAASVVLFVKGAEKYRPLLVLCCVATQLLVAYLFWYHLAHIPRWREASRGAGLNLLVLVPVNPLLARAALLSSGVRLRPGKVRRAFELHIDAARKYGLAEFARLLASDLNSVAEGLEPGTLILWETAAPVPSAFRRYVRRKQAAGEAVWQRGGWGPVRWFSSRSVRRGALIWYGKGRENFFGGWSFEQEDGDNHIFSSGAAFYGASHHGGECEVQAGQ